MTKPLVFISYSHKDEVEKEQLVAHLMVLETSGLIELWVDDKIEGGANWEQEIEQKIAQAKVVILLVSANFLTSEFILSKEIPDFLERRQKEGLIVFPIIAKSCAWDSFDWLAKMNVKPKNGIPIWSGNNNQVVDNFLANITKEIRSVVKNMHSSNVVSTSSSNNKIFFPAYSSFQKDLEKLIQEATSDFINIRGDKPQTPSDGYINYGSKFTFEYSIHNRVWKREGSWYFTCTFCEHASLQQAEKVFVERVQEIKPILANDWKFEEHDKPSSLYRKEFEAIRKYNTLKITMAIAAYDEGNNSQVDFKLEQLNS